MKKLIYLFALAAIVASCSTNPAFMVDGSIKGWKDGPVTLKKRIDGNWITVDSTQMKKGKFSFSGTVDVPGMYYVIPPSGRKDAIPFFLENSNIEITGNSDDPKDVEVHGSAAQDEFRNFYDRVDSINNQMSSYYEKYAKARSENDTTTSAHIEKELNDLYKIENDIQKAFVLDNPNSFVAPYILLQIQYGMDASELNSYVENFSADVMKTPSAQTLSMRIKKLEKVAVGQQAPDFTMNDADGKPVKLSDVYKQHKYLLVDFWASWCAPCRQENPNVVAVWQKYHNDGFGVMGVSLDAKKDAWMKAVKDDNLTWTQVSDLEGWKNSAADLYGVNSIPSNILLDQTGKIIAHNLRGDDLQNEISALLNNKK
ncbi:TlpA disulfide reductase family protein [Prolixibacter denitrificans]|nr:TlpA disulfide reductase family protein [Prolixibacter denitrificans]